MRTNEKPTNDIIHIALNSILFHDIVFCDNKDSELQRYRIFKKYYLKGIIIEDFIFSL